MGSKNPAAPLLPLKPYRCWSDGIVTHLPAHVGEKEYEIASQYQKVMHPGRPKTSSFQSAQ